MEGCGHGGSIRSWCDHGVAGRGRKFEAAVPGVRAQLADAKNVIGERLRATTGCPIVAWCSHCPNRGCTLHEVPVGFLRVFRLKPSTDVKKCYASGSRSRSDFQ